MVYTYIYSSKKSNRGQDQRERLLSPSNLSDHIAMWNAGM